MPISKVDRQSVTQIPISASEALRWIKLMSYLGLAHAEIELYSEYLALVCRSKIARLRFREDLPSYEEYVQLREMWCNAKCEKMIESSRNASSPAFQQEADYVRSPLTVGAKKASSMMGIAPQDFKYYNRYGKAVRVLGSSPSRRS